MSTASLEIKLGKANAQLAAAYILGGIAFRNGRRREAAADPELMILLAGRQVGLTPPGEATSSRILAAWLDAWNEAAQAATYQI